MHNKNKILPALTLLPLSLQVHAAGFLDDSQATLKAQNFYLNRDFREDAGISKREEWAQGFILDFRSGYTLGTLGFGGDAIGMLRLKLDSSAGRSGTGLLPVGDDGRVSDEYSKFGVAGKVRLSKTELKIGTQLLKYPTIASSTGRILPQTFQGGVLTSKELDNLTFTYAQINRTTKRDYSHSEAWSTRTGASAAPRRLTTSAWAAWITRSVRTWCSATSMASWTRSTASITSACLAAARSGRASWPWMRAISSVMTPARRGRAGWITAHSMCCSGRQGRG
ncbi:Porin-like protein NicP precursor [Pseudomonas putida]|uniref:Porin-like protein NicP n=1 Tax=Pseudomonas putida TaxID=303 RepID=A0A1Q9R8M0_PSEPU|nr:OprD family outer membrane porin [Pseudomonas putida]OLS63708.1 Porin-like protein NicP precursor [Pseudomonas putida]